MGNSLSDRDLLIPFFGKFASNSSTAGSSRRDGTLMFVAEYALALASAMPEVDVTWQNQVADRGPRTGCVSVAGRGNSPHRDFG